MALLRSEDMDLYKIQIHKDEQWNAMDEIGKLGKCHFLDLNSDLGPHELPYATDLRTMEKALERIFDLERIYAMYGVQMNPCQNIEKFMNTLNIMQDNRPLLFDSLNEEVIKLHSHIKDQLKIIETGLEKFKTLAMKMQILDCARKNIGISSPFQGRPNDDESGNSSGAGLQENLLAPSVGYMGGIIEVADIMKFKKMIIRATRAQTLIYDFPLELPETEQIIDDNYDKNKRIVIMSFQQGNVLKDKLNRVIASFEGEFFDIQLENITEEKNQINLHKEETKGMLVQSKSIFRDYLATCDKKENTDVSVFKMYKLFIMREKQIHLTLNLFKSSNDSPIIQGLCWTPASSNLADELDNIRSSKNLSGINYEKMNVEGVNIVRPTSFQQNEFMPIFQRIVDTYGTPTYKEFNPAVPAVISFPFLFGVMFGDIMHGTMLLVFSIWLVNSKRESGLGAALGEGRYIFLLMGIFSTFCGFVYNDLSSLPIMLSKSCWELPSESVIEQHKTDDEMLMNMVQTDPDCVYPFGLDYTWMRSAQEIMYLNSFKMKTSVLYGVAQMLFGTSLKMSNYIHDKKWIDLIFEAVAQFVMLLVLFGAMDWMIVSKWLIDWNADDTYQPPGVIMAMITMFLKQGVYEQPREGRPFGDIIPAQTELMNLFVIVAFICVPCMLLVKPCYYSRASKVNDDHYKVDNADLKEMIKVPDAEGQHTFGDLFIHQMIETIEYALGTVSNTASYLRLWALSLAHGKLAGVFFDQALGPMLKDGPIIGLFIGYYVFMGCTFGVLMCMDLLEAFLHTLRLHWVEFQNKFFKGSGIPFTPYSFSQIFQANER